MMIGPKQLVASPLVFRWRRSWRGIAVSLCGIAVFGLAPLSGCGEGPPVLNAVGKYSDVAVITDLQTFNSVAFQLKKVLEVDARTGLRPESVFNVDIFDMDDARESRRYKNVIVLGYLRGRDEASREIKRRLGGEQMRVMESNHLFIAVRDDVYAKNQNVIFLAGNDRSFMAASVLEEAAALRGQIEGSNRTRLHRYLYGVGRNETDEATIREQAGLRLALPEGWRLNGIKRDSSGELGCVEVLANRPTRGVAVFWKDVDPAAVDLSDQETLLALRRNWGAFLDEGLQDAFGFEWAMDEYRREEWPRLSGLYETGAQSYGGPFRTLFVLDVMSKRLYGINWYVFFPNGTKHEFLREARIVADTFSPRP